jgi:serine/threonine protein kinase
VFKKSELESLTLHDLVQAEIAEWQSGQPPDAAGFLSSHPELEREKSLALELIQNEYFLRTASGDTIRKSTFCDQFPAYRRSVAKILEVEDYFDQCPQFAVPRSEAAWPRPGRQFLGYDIVQPLGRGALARVYLAREPALGKRLVVIKVSRYGAGEAATLGRLSHENIVPVHSVQHEAETGWTAICMPLLGTATGVDLLDASAAAREADDGSVVARVGHSARPLAFVAPPATRERRESYGDAIARVGWQLAEGLQAAHAQGVVHRDLKPSNILLDWSGRPMLLDFNLSADLEAAQQRVGGTLAYMAPEQIAALERDPRAAAGQFDPRADVFSLGAVLYELLTGQLPAEPADADSLPVDAYAPWLASKAKPLAPIRTLAPRIDQRLEAIVLKCLSSDPLARYASAGELARDLKAYLGLAPAARRFARRHRWPLAIASGTALALTIALVVGIAIRDPLHQRLLDQGREQYLRREYPAAIATFTRCLELKPGWSEAHFSRGQAFRQSGEWSRARSDFVQLEPAHAAWSHALAGCCDLKAGNDLAAKVEFDQAYALGLQDRDTLLRLAFANARTNNPGAAIVQYSSLLMKNPDDVDALRGRIDAYSMQRGSLNPQAAADAERQCVLAPKSARAHHQAAVVCQHLARQATAGDPAKEQWNEQAKEYLLKSLQLGFTRQVLDNQFKAYATEVLARLSGPVPPAAAESSTRDLPLPITADLADFFRQVGAVATSTQYASTQK